MAKRDDKVPVNFILPDKDQAAVVTWAYVEDKLDKELTDTLGEIDSINTQLGRIEARIDEWLEEQG